MIHKNFRCEFYFIRHGESESNTMQGLASGLDHDSDLTDLGITQARLLGERLKKERVVFDRIYSSTLIRAVKTTKLMLDTMGEIQRDFIEVQSLIELQMPAWRGLSAEEVFTPSVVAYSRTKGSHFVPPEGESYRMVQRRAVNWLEDEIIYNKELVSKEQALRIAIVGHGTAMQCIFHYFMGFNEGLISRIKLDNCSISRFVFDKDGWSILCINDSCHIQN